VPDLRVILVEDSPAVRERIAELLRDFAGVELIGEYEDAASAINGISEGMPDVVLLDIKLRGSNGMEVMHHIIQNKIETKVIVLTNYAEPQYQEIFLRKGAHAVLDKSHEFHRVKELLLPMIVPP
jgi:two-component system, NarL family, response regulator DevR